MLLSIIIPTKNRQFTALYAVETALAVEGEGVEIVVHDCSDTPVLREQLLEKFGNDQRIRYYYTDTKPSMTENWNMALDHMKGDYCCGIGDDDAVLPEIYTVAQWAKENKIEAVVHGNPYVYFWPGYFLQEYDGSFYIKEKFSGKVRMEKNYRERIEQFGSLSRPMNYVNFPSIYHALISKRLKEQLANDTGKVLDSTSLDIYTAIAFSKYIGEYAFVDYPFSFKGASASSNSQRAFTGRTREHFDEFRTLSFPEMLPHVNTLHSSFAESFIVAAKNTRQEHLIRLIDLPRLYAHIAAAEPKSLQECKEKLSRYSPGKKDRMRFYSIYYRNRIRSGKNSLASGIKKMTPFVFKTFRKLFPVKQTATIYPAKTVLAAIELHKKYIADNQIQIQFPAPEELN